MILKVSVSYQNKFNSIQPSKYIIYLAVVELSIGDKIHISVQVKVKKHIIVYSSKTNVERTYSNYAVFCPMSSHPKGISDRNRHYFDITVTDCLAR